MTKGIENSVCRNFRHTAGVKERELSPDSTIRKFRTVQTQGLRAWGRVCDLRFKLAPIM